MRWRRFIREIIDGTSELMSNVINNRLNNTMKYLTSITLVMAVPTIISGLYGMNVNTGGIAFWLIEDGIWYYLWTDISVMSVYFVDIVA